MQWPFKTTVRYVQEHKTVRIQYAVCADNVGAAKRQGLTHSGVRRAPSRRLFRNAPRSVRTVSGTRTRRSWRDRRLVRLRNGVGVGGIQIWRWALVAPRPPTELPAEFPPAPVPAAPPPAPAAPPPAPPPCAQAPVDMPNASAAPSTRIPIFFSTICLFA